MRSTNFAGYGKEGPKQGGSVGENNVEKWLLDLTP